MSSQHLRGGNLPAFPGLRELLGPNGAGGDSVPVASAEVRYGLYLTTKSPGADEVTRRLRVRDHLDKALADMRVISGEEISKAMLDNTYDGFAVPSGENKTVLFKKDGARLTWAVVEEVTTGEEQGAGGEAQNGGAQTDTTTTAEKKTVGPRAYRIESHGKTAKEQVPTPIAIKAPIKKRAREADELDEPAAKKARHEKATDVETFCRCNSPDDGRDMVGCDGENCPYNGWVHIECIPHAKSAVSAGKDSKWFCPKCEPKKSAKKTEDEKACVVEPKKGIAQKVKKGVAQKVQKKGIAQKVQKGVAQKVEKKEVAQKAEKKDEAQKAEKKDEAQKVEKGIAQVVQKKGVAQRKGVAQVINKGRVTKKTATKKKEPSMAAAIKKYIR